jgi:hypothetical protein
VVLGRDADAGVAHLDNEVSCRYTARLCMRREPHPAASRREVEGVAKQIPNDVRDLFPIGVNGWEVSGDPRIELEAFARGQRLVERAGLLEHLGDRKRRRGDSELIRGAARVVENLADLLQQLAPAVDDPGHALELTVAQCAENAVAQDLGMCDDGCQWGAQVVRDVREELRLEGVLGAQLFDHPHCIFVPRFELGVPLLNGRRGAGIEPHLGGLNTSHMAILRQDGRSANVSCSDSSDSSNCCRLSSDQ